MNDCLNWVTHPRDIGCLPRDGAFLENGSLILWAVQQLCKEDEALPCSCNLKEKKSTQ